MTSAQFECFSACKVAQLRHPSAVSYGRETVYIIMVGPYSYGKLHVTSPVWYMGRSRVITGQCENFWGELHSTVSIISI